MDEDLRVFLSPGSLESLWDGARTLLTAALNTGSYGFAPVDNHLYRCSGSLLGQRNLLGIENARRVLSRRGESILCGRIHGQELQIYFMATQQQMVGVNNALNRTNKTVD